MMCRFCDDKIIVSIPCERFLDTLVGRGQYPAYREARSKSEQHIRIS